MKATRTLAVAALLAASASFVWAQPKKKSAAAPAAKAAAPAKESHGDPALGQKIVFAKCATCHQKNGRGNHTMAMLFKVPPTNMDWTSPQNVKKTDAQLSAIIHKGNGKMPSFQGKLQDKDIENAIAFIRSLQRAAGK